MSNIEINYDGHAENRTVYAPFDSTKIADYDLDYLVYVLLRCQFSDLIDITFVDTNNDDEYSLSEFTVKFMTLNQKIQIWSYMKNNVEEIIDEWHLGIGN